MACASLACAACSDWPSPAQPKVPDPIFQLPVASSKAVTAVESKDIDPDDLIRGGDNLEVIIRRGTGEEKHAVTVRSNGVITVAYTDIDVKGLDELSAEARIADAIKPMIRNPNVQVKLLKGPERDRWVYITGEVRFGGRFKLGKRTTVLSAVSSGQGFTDQADMSRVVIISPRGDNKNLVRVANIESALRTGDLSADLQLQADDIVFIPRSRMGDFFTYYNKVLAPVIGLVTSTTNTILIGKILQQQFANEQTPVAVTPRTP